MGTNSTTETVLLTGASGFIATHILDLLVENNYNIVATVRSEDKADFIRKKYPDSPIKIAFVKDIAADGAFDKVFTDHPEIKYVIHTASPFFNPSDNPEETMLIPAVKGTQGVLYSIQKLGKNVKHVTITSSMAAIIDPRQFDGVSDKDPHLVWSENVWSPLTWELGTSDLNLTYMASKKIAEEALWDFVKKEHPSWSATAVLPPYVWGPVIHKIDKAADINTSNQMIYGLAHAASEEAVNKVLSIEWKFPYIDVRDLAEAHILSIKKIDKSAGKRWFVTPGYASTAEILSIIDEIPQFHGKVFTAKHVPTAKEIAATSPKVINDVTNKESGIQYRSITDTIEDTVDSLLLYEKQWKEGLI